MNQEELVEKIKDSQIQIKELKTFKYCLRQLILSC